MDVLIQTVALENGNNCRHVVVTALVNGSTQVTRRFLRDDIAADADQDDEKAFLVVCRHLVKTANASTPAQVKAALEGKTVKL